MVTPNLPDIKRGIASEIKSKYASYNSLKTVVNFILEININL